MKKLNRLGWTAGFSFTAYGTRFGIRTNDSSVLEQIPNYLPLGWQPDPSPEVDILYSLRVGGPGQRKGVRHYHLVYAGASQLVRTTELDKALKSFEAHIQLLAAYLAEGYLFVHAGVVGWQGEAIVIPGRSFSGKTSLVAALVKAGATYYSDEFTLLDRQGRVHPYPVPLSIRDEAGKNARKHPVEQLGGQAGQTPLPVGLIVVTNYQAGARWQPRTLSPGRAMLALMDNTVAARKNPEFSLPILQQVAARAKAVKSRRGEAAEVAESLLRCLVGEGIPSPVSF